MLKRMVLIMLVIAFLLSAGAMAVSSADQSTQGLFDSLPGMDGYIKYHENYYLDAKKVSFFKDPLGVMFLALANLLFSLEKAMGELMVSLIDFTLNVNIFELLEGPLTPFFTSMQHFVFDGFAAIMISLCGFFLVIKLVQNRRTQVITGVFQVVVVVALALVFYTYPMQIVGGVNDVTTEISSAVMDAPYQTISGSAGSGTPAEKAAALTWNLMVHKPWQILEFGSIETANTYEMRILRIQPGSGERQDLVNDLSQNGLFASSAATQLGRITTSLIFLLFQLVIFVVIIGFCILIIGYQFLTLFLSFLGTFVFLLALIPYFGLGLVKRWAFRILAASATKVALVFFLAILFVIMSYVYDLSNVYGLLGVLFLIIVMLAIVVIKRHDLMNLFAGYGSFGGVGQMMNRSMDANFNAVSVLRNAKRDIFMNEYFSQSSNALDPAEDVVERQSEAKIYQKWPGRTEPEEFKEITRTLSEIPRQLSEMMPITAEHYKKAEEILQKNYELSRKTSEEKAARSGGDLEYTDFVKRTDAAKDMGNKFDERDLNKTARVVRNAEMREESPDQLAAENDPGIISRHRRAPNSGEGMAEGNIESERKPRWKKTPIRSIKMRKEREPEE